MVALTSPKDRVNYFPCCALSILPEVRWDCVSRLSSGRTLGGDRSNSDQESLNSEEEIIDQRAIYLIILEFGHDTIHHGRWGQKEDRE